MSGLAKLKKNWSMFAVLMELWMGIILSKVERLRLAGCGGDFEHVYRSFYSLDYGFCHGVEIGDQKK